MTLSSLRTYLECHTESEILPADSSPSSTPSTKAECAFLDLNILPTPLTSSQAKLVLTTAVPLSELFLSRSEIDDALEGSSIEKGDHQDVDDVMRSLMDDLGMNMKMLKSSSIFSGDEERFAFARALSRLSEMGSQDWVERGMGLEHKGGLSEKEGWQRVRSRYREDSM